MKTKPIADFKDRLRYVIKESGLTQAEFASKCKISRTQIFRYLTGEQSPGKNFIQNLSSQFPDIDIRWLITGATSESETESWLECFKTGGLDFYHWIGKQPFESQLAEMLVFKAMSETGFVLDDDDRKNLVAFVEKKMTHGLLREVVEQLFLLQKIIKKYEK